MTIKLSKVGEQLLMHTKPRSNEVIGLAEFVEHANKSQIEENKMNIYKRRPKGKDVEDKLIIHYRVIFNYPERKAEAHSVYIVVPGTKQELIAGIKEYFKGAEILAIFDWDNMKVLYMP